MKLIIQIPCYNEQETIGQTLSDLPRKVDGFDTVEWLIIDDGSSDRTAEIAREHGADHIHTLPNNKGLAKAFMEGVNISLELGADVIVNTDADNQYNADDIPKLTAPIIMEEAELVIGSRPIEDIQHFSYIKKKLQRLGSWIVRLVSRTDIPDAASGFRAFSRQAAMRFNVFNEYTYTLEMIIQAGQKGMAIRSVPIRVNKDLRPSRLVKSIPRYIWRSVMTIIRIFVVYKPFAFFMSTGTVVFSLGFLLGVRFLYFFFTGEGDGHVQSLILAAVLLGMGFQTMLVALLADLMSVNRKLSEDIQHKLRQHTIHRKEQTH